MKKILIIDDDPLILRTMRSLLKEKYTVLITTLPTEAVAIIGKYSPDLILLDYNMPVMNGLDALKLIRKTSGIPVIFLTGTEDSDILDELHANSMGILKKPVTESSLSDMISKIL